MAAGVASSPLPFLQTDLLASFMTQITCAWQLTWSVEQQGVLHSEILNSDFSVVHRRSQHGLHFSEFELIFDLISYRLEVGLLAAPLVQCTGFVLIFVF